MPRANLPRRRNNYLLALTLVVFAVCPAASAQNMPAGGPTVSAEARRMQAMERKLRGVLRGGRAR